MEFEVGVFCETGIGHQNFAWSSGVAFLMFDGNVSVPFSKPGFDLLSHSRLNRIERDALMCLRKACGESLSALLGQSCHVDESFLHKFTAR